MENNFSPDYYHFAIMQEINNLLEDKKETPSYSLVVESVSKKVKKLTPSLFSRKLNELEKNCYVKVVRSHPRTFISVPNKKIKIFTDMFFEMQKDLETEKENREILIKEIEKIKNDEKKLKR